MQADLETLNGSMESRSPQELIRWAHAVFVSRDGVLSAMQRAGCVVCHMAHAERIPLEVLFVDTGVHFQETLETRDRIGREYGLRVRSLQPELSMEEQTAKYGVLYLNNLGQEKCCDMRK